MLICFYKERRMMFIMREYMRLIKKKELKKNGKKNMYCKFKKR